LRIGWNRLHVLGHPSKRVRAPSNGRSLSFSGSFFFFPGPLVFPTRSTAPFFSLPLCWHFFPLRFHFFSIFRATPRWFQTCLLLYLEFSNGRLTPSSNLALPAGPEDSPILDPIYHGHFRVPRPCLPTTVSFHSPRPPRRFSL